MIINSILPLLLTLFSLYLFYISYLLLRISDEDYKRHRNLVLHPENDILGDTITSLSMGKDGLIIKKRASDGATKRFLNKGTI